MTDEGSGRRRGNPLEELEELFGRRGKTSDEEVAVPERQPEAARSAVPYRPLQKQQTLGSVLEGIRQQQLTKSGSEAVIPSKAIPPRPGLEQLLVRFEAGSTSFAVPMRQVTEIGERPPCTKVPRLPAFFPGVANIRGEIVLVLDLPLFMQPGRTSVAKRSLLIHDEDLQVLAAVLVDGIHGIAPFAQDEVRPPTSTTRHAFRHQELGVFEFQDRVYSVVDLLGLLQSQELRSHLGAQS